jgi:DNA-binding MarR family transcriptional regulator
MPDAELAATKDCHCLAARREARAITRIYEERLRPHGLRAPQFSVLAVLSLKGAGPITELAEILVVDRTTLTRSAAVLKRRGLIDEAPSDDAREHRLRITAAGRRALAAALPAWREAQELVGRQFPARTERRALTHSPAPRRATDHGDRSCAT